MPYAHRGRHPTRPASDRRATRAAGSRGTVALPRALPPAAAARCNWTTPRIRKRPLPTAPADRPRLHSPSGQSLQETVARLAHRARRYPRDPGVSDARRSSGVAARVIGVHGVVQRGADKIVHRRRPRYKLLAAVSLGVEHARQQHASRRDHRSARLQQQLTAERAHHSPRAPLA